MTGFIYIEVRGEGTDRLTLKQPDHPGAIVAVCLNGQTIQVTPAALLAAALALNQEARK